MLGPRFHRVHQRFPDTSLRDVAGAVRAAFHAHEFGSRVHPGQTVAVGVASRGTHDLRELVAATLGCLRDLGLKPYLTPAMGSHGGATGEGQAAVLAGLGIGEASMGVPVVASMAARFLGRVPEGPEVFFAEDALAADHVLVINRIKPHTGFRGEVESGLCKILAVGLGRQRGAASMHKHDLATAIVPAARLILDRVPVLCGLAVTENALGGTHSLRLVPPADFVASDRAMLKEAARLLPRLPVDRLDVLIVDQMGKNVSGAGMDPNVVGFWRRDGGERHPDYRVLVVLDLTIESHGNAMGLGLADLTTERLLAKVDWPATYLNALAANRFQGVRRPLALADDRRAVEVALGTTRDPARARVARILSTAELATFWASEALLPELAGREGLAVAPAPQTLEFGPDGRLMPLA